MPNAGAALSRCRFQDLPASSSPATALTASVEPAPFGVGAFYPAEGVTISGTSKEYVRTAASGGTVRSYFCPECGSTVYWKADNLPAMIGVAVGAIAVPNYPAPNRSVFEQSKHAWVEISGAEHFQQSSAPKHSK